MINETQITIGDILLYEAEKSQYFQLLYRKLSSNYTALLFGVKHEAFTQEELQDLLKFADIFAKSNVTSKKSYHQVLGQDIVITLSHFYSKDSEGYELIEFYKKEILQSVSNFVGLKKLGLSEGQLRKTDIVSTIADGYRILENMTPAGDYLLDSQKVALDNLLTRQYYSFSAPTSMGKTFIIRNFIEQKIKDDTITAIAIIIPTKALINELEDDLTYKEDEQSIKKAGYAITKIPTQLQILSGTKKILLFTPERMLQSINERLLPTIDYIFIDEAQKVFEDDERAPLYYKLMKYFNTTIPLAKIFFSSPYAENPDELIKFITNPYLSNNKKLASADKFGFSPVTQKQFLVDLKKGSVSIFNQVENMLQEVTIKENLLWYQIVKSQTTNDSKSIVYCKSKGDVIDYANQYAALIGDMNYDASNEKEIESLIAKIKSDINEEYYLIPLLRKKIAFHMGIMPAEVRRGIEKLVKEKKIDVVFCTSTLLEGVNLPANNIFIMSPLKGKTSMSLLDFKNLIGRAGRIRYSLWGNAFLINPANDKAYSEEYERLLKTKLERNSLEPRVKGRIQELIPSIFDEHFVVIKKKNESYATQMKFVMYRNLAIESIKENETASIIYQTYKKEIEKELALGKTIKASVEDIRDLYYTPETILKVKDTIEKGIIKIPELKILENADDDISDEVKKKELNETIDANASKIYDFIMQLSVVFDFENYESGLALGNSNNLYHYARLASRWILGQRLNKIILARLWYYEHRNPKIIRINKWDARTEVPYTGSQAQKNIVINEVMEDLEEVITFKLSRYARKFTELYKGIKGDDGSANFSDFLDYGITNDVIINIQKMGLSRELAKNIYKKGYYQLEGDKLIITNKDKLLKDKNHREEVELLIRSISQLFLDNEEAAIQEDKDF